MQYLNEVWKVIPGFNDFYEISNYGKIRSYKVTGSETIRAESYHILSPIIRKGYPTYLLDGKIYYANSLVLLTFRGEKNSRQSCYHKDGNILNLYIGNLDYYYKKDKERWRWIPGYEGLYKASTLGRICSFNGKNKYILTPTPVSKGSGYLQVGLRDSNTNQHTINVHKLVLLTFKGIRPEGTETRHLNGIPSDNRLENLKYGTHKENTYDKIIHGTYTATSGNNNWQRKRPEDTLKGSKNPASVLNEEKVYVILHLIQTGLVTLKEIAFYYSVDRSTISLIKRKVKWKQIIYPSSDVNVHNTLIKDVNVILNNIISKRNYKLFKGIDGRFYQKVV